MFIGHFGVRFSCKAAAPKASLGTYFLAAQFIDVLWPRFLLLGVEQARIEPGITTVTPLDLACYPFSHSLYARFTRATDRMGRYGLWALAVFLVAAYLADVLGAPPPSTTAVAWVGQSEWVIVLWA